MATKSTNPTAIHATLALLADARHMAILACSEADDIDAMLHYAEAANEITLRHLLYLREAEGWIGVMPQ